MEKFPQTETGITEESGQREIVETTLCVLEFETYSGSNTQRHIESSQLVKPACN